MYKKRRRGNKKKKIREGKRQPRWTEVNSEKELPETKGMELITCNSQPDKTGNDKYQ